MQLKPAYLGPHYAAAFQDQMVAQAYQYRRSCPPATFPLLAHLIHDEPRVVLDVGCGTGDIARNLVDLVDHIDAVDVSQAMIDQGKLLPRGDDPNIRWILGRAEDVPLVPPYALITAGQSLHWMDWEIVLPRFRDLLTPNGVLAIIRPEEAPRPWNDGVGHIIGRYSTNQDYQPFDMIPALEQAGLFQQQGLQTTEPVVFTQSIDAYIESFHGMSSLSRERMGAESAAAFDAEVRSLVTPFAQDGQLVLEVTGEVLWGKP
ncbi:MAG: methyltransferase domain-containing protein [Herpetosiphonaceae bacterium]|nr:methyltransferase domain-containing protein [Herpetosiphonaceae bacterium]